MVVVNVLAIQLSYDLILHQVVAADLTNLQFLFTIMALSLPNNHLLGAVRVVNVATIELCDNLIR